MKKIKSTLPNMVAVLVGVAMLTGTLLAWVNHTTAAQKEIVQRESLANDIQKVMNGEKVTETDVQTIQKEINGKSYTFVVHKLALDNGESAGSAIETMEMGFGGKLVVLVGFDKENRVLGYAIRETAETPGLGAKADTWFQKGAKGDITGKNPTNGKFAVSKDGGEVDAITASTITSRAFLKAVKQAAEVAQTIK